MVSTSDIITYNNDTWLSQDYILANTGISYSYLRVAKTRAGKGSPTWVHCVINNRCYYSYTGLPSRIAARLASPDQLVSLSSVYHDDVNNLVISATSATYQMFTATMPHDQAKSAAVIHETYTYCTLNGISLRHSDFFERVAAEIEMQSLKYLPQSWRNLRDKVRDYGSGVPIAELVKVKNAGNQNRATFAKHDTIKSWLIELAESRKNFSYAYIYRKIETMCLQQDISETPSQRWITDFLNRPETKFLIQRRYGENTRFNSHYRVYIPTKSAIHAGDCWEIDGTRVNIIDHRVSSSSTTSSKSREHAHLYIVAVRDVMSGNVLGWDYCYQESAQANINALAMAVRTAGYLPYELRFDRFPGHNTECWASVNNSLQRAGVIMTQTSKAEGKAHIERWWGTLQSVIMMESDLYYGEGIRSTRRSAHRAKEYITALQAEARRKGFDFDQAVAATDSMIVSYINRPYCTYSHKYKSITQSPEQLHTDSGKPNTYPVQQHQYCRWFGLTKEVSIRNHMIMTQIDNATYYYGIDDVDVIERYTGIKLLNCFDPENLCSVHLYTGDQYLGTFAEITPAQQYGPEKDMRAVGQLKAIAASVRNQISKQYAEISKFPTDFSLLPTDSSLLPTPSALLPTDQQSETDLLTTGRIPKAQAEAAETAYYQSEWGTDDDDISINVRNQY
jgi:hypothetical protein